MLKRLTVSNLAIVERAEAEFASGLNVITGETGSGKSVLIGALDLALGGIPAFTNLLYFLLDLLESFHTC